MMLNLFYIETYRPKNCKRCAHSGWSFPQTLVHVYLVSKKVEERRDAAKHLGLLRCGDGMVFFALKERLKIDGDSRTRYEATKSLILLGNKGDFNYFPNEMERMSRKW